ncbi:23S rRNA (uracil(1939)-C(5))-methyltransferase RlmD [Raoultibacter phocaeensis]|uniref:23S rRNA (uracil(1939)-C(5))-methyltransferase RlmD n=1 Tax=Raoultibacter phocaeensis TaxID=2479841 RepID=UPI0021084008|nr:23S rRNA (uracil(1939)-C(5))-methyltransferase RlmD [Raoultibacter phocaeensis]
MIELFSDVAGEAAVMHPIIGMDEPFFYRNKVVSPYAPGRRIKPRATGNAGAKNAKGAASRDGRRVSKQAPTHEILCGMYAAGSHRIIASDSCFIENKTAKKIILAIKDLMPAYRIEPYREDANTGFLRHAIVRVGHTSGEVLVTLVTNGRQFPGSKGLVRDLVKRCPEITSIVQNVNTRQTNVILGTDELRLYGPGFILDKLCNLSFRISSQSFYQVNSAQTEVLYRRAIELAHLSGKETVIDAYCGTGTIGLVAAKGIDGKSCAAHVIGVDETPSAIRDARANAMHNGIENATFVADDAGSFMRKLAQGEAPLPKSTSADSAITDQGAGDQHGTVVLMDPPRSGASEDFLDALVALAPDRVVYISCNPQTQARDVAYMVKRGYAVEAMQPVDMFPHTEHIENIVVCCNHA